MRRAYLIGLTLLLALPSWELAAGRDVKEIGLRALRKGRLAVEPGRDFTRIPADANYAPDRLLVRFAPNPDLTIPPRAQKNRILSSLGASIREEYDLVPGLAIVTLPANLPVNPDTLRRFNNLPGVLYAEPDYKVYPTITTPNDPYFDDPYDYQWALYNPPSGSYDINAREAWDYETGSDEIVVAVTDTGTDYTHADLAGNKWVNLAELNGTPGVDDNADPCGYVDDIYGYDFFTPDANPMDEEGHGTHVAGSIGAVGNNAVGIAGVCWRVRIMPLRFLGPDGGSDSDAILAIQYAVRRGAHVINASWGGGGYEQSLKNAIDAAGEANLIFVAAAGNLNQNTDITPNYPSCYDCANIISVLATNLYGSRSYFSNYGASTVDLGAPGEDILSCYPSGQYAYLDGTSMAAPHVTGACALLLSINPSLTCAQLKDLIMSNVTPLGSLTGYCVTGGLLNLYSAATDPDVGVISHPSLVARNSSGTIKAWIDSGGNLVLKGSLLQNQTTYPALNGIKIRNSAGTVVAALDRENGDMRISGQCHEFQNSPLTPTNANWVVKDTDGAVLAYLNSTGHLYMLGEVFDGI